MLNITFQKTNRSLYTSILGGLLVILFSFLSCSLFSQCSEDFPVGTTNWTVPVGVTAINFFASGASGGAGGNGGSADNASFLGGTGGAGGNGVSISGTNIPVNPGDVLQIIVGRVGADGASGAPGSTGEAGDGGDGGNGGGITAVINLTTNTALVIAPGGGGGAGGGGAGTQEAGADGNDGPAGSILNFEPPMDLSPFPGKQGDPGRIGANATRGNGGANGASGVGISTSGLTTEGITPAGDADGAGGNGGDGGYGGTTISNPAFQGAGPNFSPGGGGFAGRVPGPAGPAFLSGATLREIIPGASASNVGDGAITIITCESEDIPAMPSFYLFLLIFGLIGSGILMIRKLVF